MKISLDEFKCIVFGAQRIEEIDGAIVLNRFTLGQQEFIDANPDCVFRMELKYKTTAGMVLDFYTNSTSLKITVDCLTTEKELCYIDVLENGELTAHEGYDENANKSFTLETSLIQGEKRVSVYLPNLFCAKITNFELDEGASVIPYVTKKNFLFHGDSITQGYTAEYPSLSYANRIVRAFDAHCVNQAIGGAVFNPDLIGPLDFVPDKIIVGYGTNDWSKGFDYTANSLAFFEKLKETFPNSEVVVITPIWRGNIKEKEKGTQHSFVKMCEIIKNNAIKCGFKVVDGLSIVPHNPDCFVQDILHPNDYGFEHYAENLYNIIKD